MQALFRSFARRSSELVGSPIAFLLAVLLIATWAIAGPFFGYSDTWELVINTATTIVTFLMVFLIQNSQNREAKMIQLKLDELIASVKEADNRMIDLDDLPEDELERLRAHFRTAANMRMND